MKKLEIANKISDFVRSNNMSTPYGGEPHHDTNRKGSPYVVLISQKENLDGIIFVYSDKFILINTTTSYRHLPAHDSRVFESMDNALDFLKKAFVDFSADALKIPTKKKT